MRLFIAVDLPPDVRPRVAKLCQGIGGARWTNLDQLHITLRFLGDTPEDHVTNLQDKLRQVALPGFSLSLTGPGVFPPGGRKPARVLWLGLAPPGPLQSLKQAIDVVLGPDPESAQRSFSPHLTLARFPSKPHRDLDDFLAKHAAFSAGPFPVSCFHLYRSTLRPQGALHEIVESYPLGLDGVRHLLG